MGNRTVHTLRYTAGQTGCDRDRRIFLTLCFAGKLVVDRRDKETNWFNDREKTLGMHIGLANGAHFLVLNALVAGFFWAELPNIIGIDTLPKSGQALRDEQFIAFKAFQLFISLLGELALTNLMYTHALPVRL